MPLLTSSALARMIAACDDLPTLFAAFDAFADDCGAVCAVWHAFDAGVEAAARRWEPLHSTFPARLRTLYAQARRDGDDPFLRAAIESLSPVVFSRIVSGGGGHDGEGAIGGFYRTARAAGLADALGLHVFAQPGRLAYVCLGFDHRIENTDEYSLRRLQACADMFARQAAALADSTPAPRLSPREGLVVAGLASGASNKEIARRLGLSLGAVNTLVNRSFTKLGAHSRTEAAVAAARRGLALVA